MKNIVIKTFAFAAAAASMLSCAGNKGSETAQTPVIAEDQATVVQIYYATKQEVPQDETYSATIQANVTNNIAPQSGNRIQKLLVDVGDFVKAGQIVAEMDRVQLDQAALKLANEKTELERVRQLFNEGGVSQSDFDSMEMAYKVSKSTYDNLLENTVLRSPVDGVISARNYDRGDMYAMASPIYTVQQITPVKLLVGVSEKDYTKVKKGDKVSLSVDAFPGQTFTGNVSRIYPTMDAASHTFNVEVKVANTSRELRPGMYARATLTFAVNSSIVVPDGAVVKMQGSGVRSVFVVNSDRTVTSKVVTLGRHFGSSYEVLEGIEEGETVVVKGNSSLKNGSKVIIGE